MAAATLWLNVLLCNSNQLSYSLYVSVIQIKLNTFVVSRAFMAGAASQAGDADSSRAPGFTSDLQGFENVHRGALLLVPQWQCISSFVFYVRVSSALLHRYFGHCSFNFWKWCSKWLSQKYTTWMFWRVNGILRVHMDILLLHHIDTLTKSDDFFCTILTLSPNQISFMWAVYILFVAKLNK